jgi:hypothetical protein
MEALMFFKDVDTTETTRENFLKLHHDYNTKYNVMQQLKFQMRDTACLEFHINLFKIFCSGRVLNKYHQHIVINYAGLMSNVIRTHHMSDDNVEFRHVFVSFLWYIQTHIVKHHSEQGYWFRIVFHATTSERNIGLAITYLQLLDTIFNSIELEYTEKRVACVNRIVSRNVIKRLNGSHEVDESVPNLIDYAIRMYPQHHSMSWPLFTECVLNLVHIGGNFLHRRRYPSGKPCIKFDSKFVQLVFYFLNDDDNQDMYDEILQLLNNVLFTNCINYDIKLFTDLFTPHNLYTLVDLPALFQNDAAKKRVQNEVLRLFNYIFLNVEIDVPRYVIEHIYKTLEIYNNIDDTFVVYDFLTLTHQVYHDLDYNLEQIKCTLEYIESTDVDNDDMILLSDRFLPYLHDIFVHSTTSICELGLEQYVFKTLVNNYQFLTMSSQNRVLMANIVYEFIKIGNGHPELKYADILVDSGYLYIVNEDDNIYNLTILNKILNNYISTSLVDKCIGTLDQHADLYDSEHIDDALEIINGLVEPSDILDTFEV